MSNKFIISIVILNWSSVLSQELAAIKPYERNSVLNKGVWVRNKVRDTGDANSVFIFRGNAVDVENQLQGEFSAFSDVGAQNSPSFSSYVERKKRSPANSNRKSYRKNLTECGSNKNCIPQDDKDDKSSIKPELINKLKPSSVFNDYPYEVLLNNNDNRKELNKINNTIIDISNIKGIDSNKSDVMPLTDSQNPRVDVINFVEKDKDLKNKSNVIDANNNVAFPKRSTKNDYETEIIKKIEITEEINKTSDEINVAKSEKRDVIDNSNLMWHQNAPVSNINRYSVVPKVAEFKKSKLITEGGLIKVLSVLTKTFKKIIKQHDDIKEIHEKLHTLNKEFLNNVDIISGKFNDFNVKYIFITEFNEKFKALEEKLRQREKYFKTKEGDLAKNLIEFEAQQKKFLNQQRQFYNIQKIMLSQNEKINAKQNLIAKSQSEISHRQNNFARILKKAKQLYIDNKLPNKPAIISTFSKSKYENRTYVHEPVTHTTTLAPQATDSVKINLFSIPSVQSRLENQDHLLLKEKELQPLDDLVYKYYFNNTFIDNFMKSKFLSSFVATAENTEVTRNTKNKRNQMKKLETTLLLPINNPKSENTQLVGNSLNRERRWISHSSRHRSNRKNRGKGRSDNAYDNGETTVKNSNLINESLFKSTTIVGNAPNDSNLHKDSPFYKMATNFCTEIGQSTNQQLLNWCVEKALRRLKNIDMKIPTLPPPPKMIKEHTRSKSTLPSLPTTSEENSKIKPQRGIKNFKKWIGLENVEPKFAGIAASSVPQANSPTTETLVTFVPTYYTPMTTIYSEATENIQPFPGNDELESNLQQYELNLDTEGNYYWDGSIHASEVVGKDDNNDAISDMMPGIDSDSRIDKIDPDAFDPQALRKAYARRMKYENMLKKMSRL